MSKQPNFPSSFDLQAFFACFPASTKGCARNAETHLRMLKTQAKLLRKDLSDKHDCQVGHSQSLELVVRSLGFADFNHARHHFDSLATGEDSAAAAASGPGSAPAAFIPEEVRALLVSKWRHDPGKTRNVAQSGDDRLTRPSYYQMSEGQDYPSTFSYEEALGLAQAGAFGVGVRIHETHVSVNEHAQHSLEEFLGDVCEAWTRHKQRLAEFLAPFESGNKAP